MKAIAQLLILSLLISACDKSSDVQSLSQFDKKPDQILASDSKDEKKGQLPNSNSKTSLKANEKIESGRTQKPSSPSILSGESADSEPSRTPSLRSGTYLSSIQIPESVREPSFHIVDNDKYLLMFPKYCSDLPCEGFSTYDLKTGKQVTKVNFPSGERLPPTLIEKTKYISSVEKRFEGAGKIFIFDPSTSTEKLILDFESSDYILKLSPNGKYLYYAYYSKKSNIEIVRIFDISTLEEMLSYQTSENALSPIWSPDDKYLVFKDDDHLSILDVRAKSFRKLKVYTNGDPAWSADSDNLLIFSKEDQKRFARVFNIRTGKLGQGVSYDFMSYDPKSHTLIAANGKRSSNQTEYILKRLNAGTWDEVASFAVNSEKKLDGFEVLSTGKYMCILLNQDWTDAESWLYETQTGRKVHLNNGIDGCKNYKKYEWIFDDRFFISFTRDKESADAFRAESGEMVWTSEIDGETLETQILPNGKYVARSKAYFYNYPYSNECVQFFESENLKRTDLICTKSNDWWESIFFSQSGRLLAISDYRPAKGRFVQIFLLN